MKLALQDKFVFCDFQSNSHGLNKIGMTYRRGGLIFHEWSTNNLKSICIDSGMNTMETGAVIKVWGVRA